MKNEDIIVCGTRDNSLRERLLREYDFTLSKAISAGNTAEETRKHAHKILKSQPTANIDQIFKSKLTKSSQPEHKRLYVCNKNKHFKVCCPRVRKKVHKIEKDESDEPSDQSHYEFFIGTFNIQNSAFINQIKN